jgi:cytochrome b6-f complex iron-sulfur subunit
MAEKKKMSVAEILAAARKADSGQAKGGAAGEAAGTEQAVPGSAAAAPDAAATPAEPATPKPAAPTAGASAQKPKPAAAAGGKPSIAEILAMARANATGARANATGAGANKAAESGGAPPAAAPAARPEAAKPAAKPAAKVEKPVAVKERPAAKGGDGAAPPRDTSSILAAARAGAKAGPMSKAEAAGKLKPHPQEASTGTAAGKTAKAAVVAPPPPAKPEYARPKPSKEPAIASEDRRYFLFFLLGSSLALGFVTLSATLGLWTLAFARFMFPNILMEPPNKFKVGFTSDFPAGGVEEKYKPQFGVWIVNTEYKGNREIFALKTVCTHLGCTPNWLEAEQKFKCPCHGSGFYKDGINFEGPAPRPLERYAIRIADDGQLEVDKSKTFHEELGQWKDPASFVPV